MFDVNRDSVSHYSGYMKFVYKHKVYWFAKIWPHRVKYINFGFTLVTVFNSQYIFKDRIPSAVTSGMFNCLGEEFIYPYRLILIIWKFWLLTTGIGNFSLSHLNGCDGQGAIHGPYAFPPFGLTFYNQVQARPGPGQAINVR